MGNAIYSTWENKVQVDIILFNNLTIGCIFNLKDAKLTITIQKTIVPLNFCFHTHEKGTIPTRKTITVPMRMHPL